MMNIPLMRIQTSFVGGAPKTRKRKFGKSNRNMPKPQRYRPKISKLFAARLISSNSRCARIEGVERHDLTDTKLARLNHRAVYAGVILVHTNNSLHHFSISLGCVWIKINHD